MRTRYTRPRSSVAMPALAANSAGEEIARPHPARLRVMLPLPLPEALDYLAPEGIAVPEPGCFVRVGLGSRHLVGVVWEGEAGEALPVDKLKPILEVLPTPPLPPEIRRFLDRVAAYTLAPPGMALKMAMSVEDALLPRAPRRVCTIIPAGPAPLATAEPPTKQTTAPRRAPQGVRREGAWSPAAPAPRRGRGPR